MTTIRYTILLRQLGFTFKQGTWYFQGVPCVVSISRPVTDQGCLSVRFSHLPKQILEASYGNPSRMEAGGWTEYSLWGGWYFTFFVHRMLGQDQGI